MVIKRITIDNNFPIWINEEIKQINENLSFCPIWQSIEWNLMLQNTNYISKGIFIGVFEGKNLLNFVIIEKRGVGMSKYGNFIIGGPNKNDYIAEMSSEIDKLGQEENVLFTQIESLVEIDIPKFKKGMYKKFIEKCTAFINLEDGREKILSKMKQKGRYNIKIAEKSGITVEKARNNKQNLNLFYNLLSETKERDNFNINSEEYFKKLLEYVYGNNIGALYLAKKDNELIAGGIFIDYLKTRYYYYGASTSDNEKRKYMATYLLQWFAIEDAIKIGMINFDFLGITCPGCRSKKLAGITDFKLKLTPDVKLWPDSKILVQKKFWYFVLNLKNIAKKIFKK